MAENQPKVKVYSTTWCGFCKMAKEYLAGKKVTFEDINVENDMAAGMYIMQKTGQAGVPVIEIGDEVILGFDRERIDGALRQYKLVN